MQPARRNKNSEQALETMFTAKYAWLLRWALHFAQNDPAAAEDLVQDTFVRILLLKDPLRDPENIEPLLYTHLKYAYLTERRKCRNHAFQTLAAADFDTLSISLRTSSSFDQIEVQNDLRKILVFLLWRRRVAKFANIFLLRFFHEFSHEEVAALCLVSRHAVDLGLARAREELKSYLANPQQIRVLGRGNAPEYKPLHTAAASDRFAIEMMEEIFGSPCGTCPDIDRFQRLYRTFDLRPLDNDLISHVVSCKPCLEMMTKACGLKPPSPPSASTSIGVARHTLKPTKPGLSEKKALASIFDNGRRRVREIYHHHPSDLIIAINGEVVAVRDISSPRSVLKVETRAAAALELIEIYSEQGLLMLTLPIVDHPPLAPPELEREVEFSGGRLLALNLRYTGDGAQIEATYFDPDFSLCTADEEALIEESSFDNVADVEGMSVVGPEDGIPVENIGLPKRRSWWRRLFEGARFRRRGLHVSLAFAVLVGAIVIWICVNHRSQQIEAEQMVREAMHSESRLRAAFGPGVIHQRVEIRAAGHTIQRDVYRDLDARRRQKPQPLDQDTQALKAKLAEAEFDWNDPISTAGFESWRNRFPHRDEETRKAGSDLLTLTTTASSGPLLQQSITIRLGDFHPVARDFLFRDQENVEVAELSYEVVAWGPAADEWFEPLSGDLPKTARNGSGLQLPARSSKVSEDQLDVANLGVLFALQELRADTERLQVSRTSDKIAVTGIVESDGRKLELTTRLREIPHVAINISSYRDFQKDLHKKSEGTSIKAITATAEGSPIDRYCEARFLPLDGCRKSARQILNSSTVLARESSRLFDLRAQYPSTQSLGPAAQALLRQLITLHIRHLQAAIEEEQGTFPFLQVSGASHAIETRSPAPELHDLAQRNLELASEFVYADDEQARSAPQILEELATSARNVQAALSRIEQFTTGSSESSPVAPATHPR
jgi:RNA polymerase sigma factor (sigma-70 family)